MLYISTKLNQVIQVPNRQVWCRGLHWVRKTRKTFTWRHSIFFERVKIKFRYQFFDIFYLKSSFTLFCNELEVIFRVSKYLKLFRLNNAFSNVSLVLGASPFILEIHKSSNMCFSYYEKLWVGIEHKSTWDNLTPKVIFCLYCMTCKFIHVTSQLA